MTKYCAEKIDGIFDGMERENLRKPQNAEDGFQGKATFPGGPGRFKSPLLYLLSKRALLDRMCFQFNAGLI